MRRASPHDLQGGDEATNAQIVLGVLKGAEGPRRDAVLLNAAAAVCAGGLADDIAGGLPIAQKAIDSGKALEKLEQLKAMSNAG